MIGHPDAPFRDAVERHHEVLAAAVRAGGPVAPADGRVAALLRRLRGSRPGDARAARGVRARPARP